MNCQLLAWVDVIIMQEWLNKILFPHLRAAPEGVTSIVLLDSYVNHCKDHVKEQIEATSSKSNLYVHPVDVVVAKLFKDGMHHNWCEWMEEQGVEHCGWQHPNWRKVTF